MEATIMDTSVRRSMSGTKSKNRKASIHTGTVSPTFSVPGISTSSTDLVSLNIVVDGANDPIPSVSKKLATTPMMRVAIRFFGCIPLSQVSLKVRPVTESFSVLPAICFCFLSMSTTMNITPKSEMPLRIHIPINKPPIKQILIMR